jgi:glycosyltransferase involved in cell wall biosynthesis
VGRLIREKHVDLVIHAVNLFRYKNPDIRALIIGEGPEYAGLKNLINENKLDPSVHLSGFYWNHDDLIARLKSSKVFVLPSTREGFGITALEALACGIPVVTVDHPANAIRDLITGKNGFLCSLSAQDLSEKIGLALRHHLIMHDACMMSAESFDWDRITSDVESYYQSVIKIQN